MQAAVDHSSAACFVSRPSSPDPCRPFPVHKIRLRRPWLRTVDEPKQSGDRVDVPDPGHLELREGSRLIYRRAFNRPTGLEIGDKVWLSIDSYSGRSIRVLLNDQSVFQSDTREPIRIDLTTDLEAANRLEIRLAGSMEEDTQTISAGLDGEVSLQIEPRR